MTVAVRVALRFARNPTNNVHNRWYVHKNQSRLTFFDSENVYLSNYYKELSDVRKLACYVLTIPNKG